MKDDFIQVLRFVRANEKFVAKKVDPIMEAVGLEGIRPFEFQEPVEIGFIPTLQPGVNRPITEMLKSRFSFAARIIIFGFHFLGPEEMTKDLEIEGLMSIHQAYKEGWEGSAPNIYPEGKLSFFGSTEGLSSDPFYLVWKNDGEEPEVWIYCGHEEIKYPNVDAFFRTLIGGLLEECGIDWRKAVYQADA